MNDGHIMRQDKYDGKEINGERCIRVDKIVSHSYYFRHNEKLMNLTERLEWHL